MCADETPLMQKAGLDEVRQDLFQLAQRDVLERYGDRPWDDDNFAAVILFKMIESAERKRNSCRAIQARAAVMIAERQLWLAFPPTPECQDGFGSLRELLLGTGLSRRAAYELELLAEYIVPYCNAHGIDIWSCITDKHYAKLVEAIPHLRRTIRDPDAVPEDVAEVLRVVRMLEYREDIRTLYQRPRDDLLGIGGVNHLRDGRAVVTLVLDEGHDVPDLLPKLQGRFRWDMVVTAQLESYGISIRVHKVDDARHIEAR